MSLLMLLRTSFQLMLRMEESPSMILVIIMKKKNTLNLTSSFIDTWIVLDLINVPIFAVFWIRFRIRLDLFHWSGSGSGWPKWNGSKPDPVAKNQPKSWKISTNFKTIKLMFTVIIIYSINNKTDHILEKYIF